jgi:hypothetical protein
MKPVRTAVVVTSIFEPAFLDGYLRQIEASGQRDDIAMWIIIDRKSPASLAAAAHAARERGYRVECPALDEQEQFLQHLATPAGFIPYNTDNRRNVGFLMALEAGCESLISIDDDNFCLSDQAFFAGHDVVGQLSTDPVISSSTGWYNICDLLGGWTGASVFPRGYPYRQQHAPPPELTECAPLPVAINAGLWLDDPDVDAIYRLCRRPKVTRFSGRSVVLQTDTWAPINTQNTALIREAALTYYYVRMGYPLQGLKIDRFGDILSGYLTQKVAKHLGYGVRFGTPLLDHRRTPHNLFKDLYHELAGIVVVEEFLPWLTEVRLTGSSMLEAYQSLAMAIAADAGRFQGFVWDDGGRDFLTETAQLMQTWVTLVRRFV